MKKISYIGFVLALMLFVFPAFSEAQTERMRVVSPNGGSENMYGAVNTGTSPIIVIPQRNGSDEIFIRAGVRPEKTTISVGEVSASTDEELEVEENRIFFRKKEVKIMPDVASEVAIAKLGDLGFTIELKNMGKDDEARPSYEVRGMKQVKILGIFRAKIMVSANIDAETGVVSELKKPWWSFLTR